MSSRRAQVGGTGAADAKASQPTQEHQEQQRNYAFENQTRGAAQLRSGDPMDFGMITYHKDPMDEQMQIRRELMGVQPPGQDAYAQTAVPTTDAGQLLGIPTGMIQRTMPITDAEIAYAQRWQAQEQQVMFDQAVASMFDLTNPAERDRVMKLFPGYFARQRAFVDSKFAVMRKYVDIAMTGIQSEEDAKFVYNVRAGLIQLPAGYADFDQLTTAMNPVSHQADKDFLGGKLVDRGPFNIYQYFKADDARSYGGYTDNFKAYAFGPRSASSQATFGGANFWGAGSGVSESAQGPPYAPNKIPPRVQPAAYKTNLTIRNRN